MKFRMRISILATLVAVVLIFTACSTKKVDNSLSGLGHNTENFVSVNDIPEFDDKTPYVIINNNNPDFDDEDLVTESYENYSPLDELGRCGVAMACIGTDIMPTEERGSIGQVKPSGWHLIKYDNVDGKYLYNRCHLIGYQLTGENANTQNLITGTRYLNVEGMLPFENMIADYVKTTGYHVIYRVTPIFEGENLLASGVQMEGMSVEDGGKGIRFNVYAYNSQPGITINYLNGESCESGKADSDTTSSETDTKYVLNTNTKKIHLPDCSSVEKIKSENKQISYESADDLKEKGYTFCGACLGN